MSSSRQQRQLITSRPRLSLGGDGGRARRAVVQGSGKQTGYSGPHDNF